MQIVSKTKMTLTLLTIAIFFMLAGIMETADARVKGGGRSFQKAPTASKPAAQTKPPQGVSSPMGGSFARGLAGGVMGGVLGSMLFGGMANAGGGGLGGSGFGVFEILLLAGVGYFLYRRFSRRTALAGNPGMSSSQDKNSPFQLFSGAGAGQESPDNNVEDSLLEDPLVTGVREIWAVDNNFDPDAFKETAQDLFFKIQAGWTRRDASVLEPFVGNQLLDEYKQHFDELKQLGHFNRLENIAVRKVDLIAAGVQDSEIFVTVRFTANLLDYTVGETSGEIVKGDSENSVKFDEEWTFTTPVGAKEWKLEGIEA